MRKTLFLIISLAALPALSGCAALWVTDKAVDTVWFATKTTAKVGAGAAELTWDAGSAAAGAVSGEEEEDEEE